MKKNWIQKKILCAEIPVFKWRINIITMFMFGND